VPFSLFCVVGALLVTWAYLRRRRIEAAAGGPDALGSGWDLDQYQTATRHRDVSGFPASAPSISRPRPALARLGLNPLGQRLVALNAVLLVVGGLIFSGRGLTVEWSTVWFSALLLGVILVAWLNFYFVPGARKEWFVAEVLFVALLLAGLTNAVVPLQYGAVAMGSPYADPWLAAADARMGVHVATLAAWTRAHPATSLLATFTYATFLPQLVLTVFALAALRERERLWEFAFHFHVCLIVTIAALAIWPAVCPPAHYGFKPTIDMTRVIGQIKGFHQGTMTVVSFDDLEGLVSFPSFHVAGALLVTWAFRRRRWILIPLAVLNCGLMISTFVTGVHYLVDVIASVPLVAGSLAAYRWWGRPLLTAEDYGPPESLRTTHLESR
jgi:membrane-associated phospholipid phosphatase